MALLSGAPLVIPQYGRTDLAFQAVELGVQPAPGAQFIYTVTGNYIVVPVSIRATLATDPTVINRVVSLQFWDALRNTIVESPSNVGQPASSIVNYTWMTAVASPSILSGFAGVLPMPLMPLLAGYMIVVTWYNSEASDQLSNIVFQFQKYPTGPAVDTAASPQAPGAVPPAPTVETPVLA